MLNLHCHLRTTKLAAAPVPEALPAASGNAAKPVHHPAAADTIDALLVATMIDTHSGILVVHAVTAVPDLAKATSPAVSRATTAVVPPVIATDAEIVVDLARAVVDEDEIAHQHVAATIPAHAVQIELTDIYLVVPQLLKLHRQAAPLQLAKTTPVIVTVTEIETVNVTATEIVTATASATIVRRAV